jgi:drug/metabolite transporter (DMT)-like permease
VSQPLSAAAERRKAYLAWAAVCFFWGTTYLAIRLGVEDLPPALFAGSRFLIAGSLLFVWQRLRGAPLPVGREWRDLAVVGLALPAVGNLMVVNAQQTVPSGLAALLVALTPFWMTGIEAALGGERLTVRGVGGLLIGFMGLVVLALPHLRAAEAQPAMVWGIGAIQVGCLSWSLGSIYSRRNPVGTPPLMGAAVQMLTAGAALMLIGTGLGEWPRYQMTHQALAALAYLVVFGSMVAYGCYIYSLQVLPISTVSLYAYINPLVAVFLGWLVLAERVGWAEWTALALTLGGVALVKSGGRGEATRQEEPAPTRR